MILNICKLVGLLCLTGPAEAVDGDTLYLKTEKVYVRLLGIDAEEFSEPNGPHAKLALSAFIMGKTLKCVPEYKSYSRITARCFADGQDIGAALVASGAVLDCARYSNGEYRILEPRGARQRLTQKPYC